MLRMRSARFGPKSIPAAFALVTVVAYGLLLPSIGFYWDDWPFAWIARFLGPSAFIPAFEGFRPFLGPIFLITSSLLPPDPMVWQVFALLVRFAATLAAWFALRQVWPAQRPQTLAAALLFLVFPAYSQHWVAYTHINQEWISFIAYLLSLGLSARAVRDRHHCAVLSAGALALQAFGLLPTEYFIGLEPLRFLFFFVMAGEGEAALRRQIRRAFAAWWPYLLVWLANLAWLTQYYRSGAYISYEVTATTAPTTVGEMVLVFGDALWKAGLYAWAQIPLLLMNSFHSPTGLLTTAIIVVAFIVGLFYLLRLDLGALSVDERPNAGQQEGGSAEAVWQSRRRTELAFVTIGAAGVVLGRVPSFVAGLPLTLQSSFDRFTISMMLGGSLFAVGLVGLLLQGRPARVYAVAGLLALGIGQQFFNANIFRRDWQRQTEIYWQFAWRIPELKPHTAIITRQLPLDYETDLSMTAALNWIYAPHPEPPDLPYAVVYSEKRLGGAVLPDLSPGVEMRLPFRTMEFAGNTSRSIAIYVPSNGCLRVFDPTRNDQLTYSRLPEYMTALVPLSNPSLIVGAPADRRLPTPPFGREPARTWCYYYEKAELARQQGDWETAAGLASQAAERGFSPEDPFEWLPFIEAYARTGSLEMAEQLTHQALKADPKLLRGLCVVWERVRTEGEPAAKNLAASLDVEIGCAQ